MAPASELLGEGRLLSLATLAGPQRYSGSNPTELPLPRFWQEAPGALLGLSREMTARFTEQIPVPFSVSSWSRSLRSLRPQQTQARPIFCSRCMDVFTRVPASVGLVLHEY